MDKLLPLIGDLADALPAWDSFDWAIHGPALTAALFVLILFGALLKGIVRMFVMGALGAALALSGFLDPYVNQVQSFINW